MSKVVRALAIGAMLVATGTPVAAQADTALCLRVQATSEVDLTDPSAVRDGIGSGEIVVTEVVPCETLTTALASASPIPDTGAWKILYDETDQVTGDRRVSVYLDAVSGVSRLDLPIQLLITCSNHGVEAAVSWGWDLGPEAIIDVDTRIGDGEITTDPWFNEGEDTGYGRGDTVFIESLFGESQLAVKVTTPEAGPISALFDIAGTEAAVAGVREACAW